MSQTEPEATTETDSQCKAATSSGDRCTRPAQDDGFCYQHDEDSPLATSDADDSEPEAESDDQQESPAETPSFLEQVRDGDDEDDDLKDEPFDPDDFGPKSWEFGFKGYRIKGSDPADDDPSESRGEDDVHLTADDKVAKLMMPTSKGDLLFWRAIQFLHDSPEIDRETWMETFGPKDRMQLANAHLNEFGLDDFRDDIDLEEAAEMVETSEQIERAKMRGEFDPDEYAAESGGE